MALRQKLTSILSIGLLLSAPLAYAQSAGADPQNSESSEESTAFPVWNNQSGRLEAILLIDKSVDTLGGSEQQRLQGLGLSTRWKLNSGDKLSLDLQSLGQTPRLGLVCDHHADLSMTLQDCQLAQWQTEPSVKGSSLKASLVGNSGSDLTASLSRREFRIDDPSRNLMLMSGPRFDPSLLFDPQNFGSRIEQNEAGLEGTLKIGQQGWVRLGGSVARARLVSPSQFLPGSLPPQWDVSTLTLEAGKGSFGGEIVSQSIQIPGAESSFSTLGLGITWRTPWHGKLSVGARSLITNGDNPFLKDAADGDQEEGRVPYVRYQQDL